MILRPVLAPTPGGLAGRRNVRAARAAGQRALEEAARLARVPGPRRFLRDAERAPLPLATQGPGGPTWHWSTTNTRGLVAAVVAPRRVGIDAEWLDRPRLAALLAYLPPDERAALGRDERRSALALWCAKEAVLKLTGIGMAGMGRTRLVHARGPDALELELDGARFPCALHWQGAHVLALACDAPVDGAPLVLRPAALGPARAEAVGR